MRYRRLREQACDAFAVRRMEGCPIRSYGELLLTLAERPPSGLRWRIALPSSMLGFLRSYFRKYAVANRLRALRTAGVVRGRLHTCGVASLIGLVAACGLTDASSPAASHDPSSEWLPVVGRNWDWNPWQEVEEGPFARRTYDVELVLNRIADGKLGVDDARERLKRHLIRLLDIEGVASDHASASGRRRVERRFTLDGSTLTLHAPLGTHTELSRNLIAWERSGFTQISVAALFITDERDIASEIGVSWRHWEAFSAGRTEEPLPQVGLGVPVARAQAVVDDYLPIAVATLNDEQARMLVNKAQKGEFCESRSSPEDHAL